MREFKKNTIIKKEFIKLNEKDVMFITNPGRMGDEDGSTFIIKQGNEYIVYRIDGWLYGKKELSKDIRIMEKLQTFIRSRGHVEKNRIRMEEHTGELRVNCPQ